MAVAEEDEDERDETASSLRLRKAWSRVRRRLCGVGVGAEGKVVAVLGDVAVSRRREGRSHQRSGALPAESLSRRHWLHGAVRERRSRRNAERNAPNPRQRLIPTLLHDLEVPHLNPTHGKVGNLKLDRDGRAFVDFLCA